MFMVSQPCPTCGSMGFPHMSPIDAPARLIGGWWVTPITYFWNHLAVQMDCGPFFTEYRESA